MLYTWLLVVSPQYEPAFLFVVDFTLRASASDNLKLHFTLFLCFVIIFTDRGIMCTAFDYVLWFTIAVFSFHFNLLQQEKRPVALRFSPFFWFCLYSQHQPWGGAAPRPSSHINRLLRTGCGCSDKQQYVSEFIPSSVLTSVSLYFLYSHSSECHSVLPAQLHFISSRILRSNDWRSASRVINMSNVELETNLDCISYNKECQTDVLDGQ